MSMSNGKAKLPRESLAAMATSLASQHQLIDSLTSHISLYASRVPSPSPSPSNHITSTSSLSCLLFASSFVTTERGAEFGSWQKQMASTSTASSSSALSTLVVDGKAPRQPPPQKSQTLLTSLPPSPALHSPPLSSASAYCRKIARNVAAMATGEAPAEVAAAELPEILKSAIEAWDKVEDKYAVSSLAVAVVVALWGSTGMISAIDSLPLIPGVLELVGIGYTGWFAYKNLVFKPDREALVRKIRDIYSEVTGSS